MAQSKMTSPAPQVLDNLVRRIVEAVHPLRIILFGSAARGQMGPHSDLDVVVVMPDGCDTLSLAQELHCTLGDFEVAKDFVVVQESDFKRNRDNPYLIVHTALTEGRELYHAS